jgi:hypothetical protein
MSGPNWYRVVSNMLLLVGAACAVLGVLTALGWFDRPGLTARPQVADIGEVSAETVPLAFTLRNHTRQPIRLVGALEA